MRFVWHSCRLLRPHAPLDMLLVHAHALQHNAHLLSSWDSCGLAPEAWLLWFERCDVLAAKDVVGSLSTCLSCFSSCCLCI
jgi:hypothetical protein